MSHEDELFTVLAKSLNQAEFQRVPYQINDNLVDVIGSLFHLQVHDRPNKLELHENHAKLLPSSISPPKLELKPLSNNLKYAYLGDNETLPVIISSALTLDQEEKLVKVLREHSKAIGWTLAYLKGLSPSLCSHKIKLEKDAKPKRDPQMRLNPPVMEVVQKEILKWLDAGVIYPIADFEWVSLIHVVSKKGGTTIV